MLRHPGELLLSAIAVLTGANDCARPGSAPQPTRNVAAIDIRAAYSTDRLTHDPDDPAIWVHPTEPGRSLIIATMKAAAPDGAVVVFGMDGRIRQLLSGLDRPNNVDVEYGLRLGRERIDIAVATERLERQLRIFAIDRATGRLTDLGGAPVLQGVDGEAGAPMGIALYKRPRDGAIFAIVAPKDGPRDGYLWQYRLADGGGGRVTATFVRRFGRFSGSSLFNPNEIEAVAVDDALGHVYYADERDGIHKWHADPGHVDTARELAHFARSGYKGDREGIAIYARPDGTGYIVCTDQVDGDSEYHVYAREGAPGRPHDHESELAVLRGGTDATDGLEISSSNLGAGLPQGAMIAMNSGTKNFLVFRWDDVAAALPTLRLRSGQAPRGGR